MFRNALTFAAPSTALVLAAHSAFAQVVVWPVDPTIKRGEQATAVWIENQGVAPLTVQIRAFGWSQPGGVEALSDQDQVVASPPIATVPTGQRQMVRLIRRNPAGPAEQSFRLLIDELPAPPSPDKPAGTTAGLGVQMRYSIPLFTYTQDPAALGADLKASLEQEGGKSYLALSNTGAKHARLVNLRGAPDEPSLVAGLVGYVLPGQTMRFPLPDQAAGQATFIVNVNGADQRLTPATRP